MVDHYGPNVDAAALWTYGVLLRFRNQKTGICCPSHETLARLSRCSVSTVKRRIAELATAGLVEVSGRKNGKGQASNQYTLRSVVRPGQSAPARSSPGRQAGTVGYGTVLAARANETLDDPPF